jgi:hypothetical protein
LEGKGYFYYTTPCDTAILGVEQMVKTQTAFQRHERADERLRSAANLVKVLLQAPDLSKEHRRVSAQDRNVTRRAK